jgi:hypothetical protein
VVLVMIEAAYSSRPSDASPLVDEPDGGVSGITRRAVHARPVGIDGPLGLLRPAQTPGRWTTSRRRAESEGARS